MSRNMENERHKKKQDLDKNVRNKKNSKSVEGGQNNNLKVKRDDGHCR